VNRVEYQASFWFPVTPPQMWATIERFDLFESWWAWLADFRADDGGLVPGNVLHGTVIPPVPYRLRLDARLQRCDRLRLIEAMIGWDLRGQAALRLEAAGDGTRAEVAWSLRMHRAPLRVATRDRHQDLAVDGDAEAGQAACRERHGGGVPRVRVAAGDGRAAAGCLVPAGGGSPDLAGVPGGMPLTLASSSVPQGCGE